MNPRILYHNYGSCGSMCLNYIWEWSIQYGSLSMIFTLLHGSTNQELSKSTSVIKVATMKNMAPYAPVIIWNWSIHFPSLSAMFNFLRSNTNQELFKKHYCNQGSHYEKFGRFAWYDFHYANHVQTTNTVSKDEWNTKEDSGKSLKNVLDVLRYAKVPLGLKRRKTVKNFAHRFCCYQVMLVWRYQLVS